MTTKLSARPGTRGSSSAAAKMTGSSQGRFASWCGGWQVASRMARRDIRAHRVRSLIVVVMIAVPMALMIGVAATFASGQVTIARAPEAYLGTAQARLSYIGNRVESQSPDGSVAVPACSQAIRLDEGPETVDFGMVVERRSDGWSASPVQPGGATVDATGCDYGALPVPGMPASGAQPRTPSPEQAAAALGAWLGGTVVPISTTQLQLHPDVGVGQAQALVVDARPGMFRGMVELTEGRWPAEPGEVLVTRAGESAGLPTTGTVRLSSPYGPVDGAPPGPGELTVVGRASVAKTGNEAAALVAYPGVSYVHETAYLLDRAGTNEPVTVTWEEVQRLHAYGIVTTSDAVLDDPPYAPVDAIPGVVAPGMGAAQWFLTVIVPTLALLAVACLMAGPAFAITAATQRRMLALVAANGAPAVQLRRTVMAEALMLGAVSAMLAVASGLGVAAVMVAAGRESSGAYGPFDVPWLPVLGVAVSGILAAFTAALVPTRGLGRLDLASELGSGKRARMGVSQRVGSGLLGGLLMLTGALLLAFGNVAEDALALKPGTLWGPALIIDTAAAGLAAVVAGGLAVVSPVLTLLQKSGARLPITLRLALRDVTRTSGRATPTIAAIMAGTMLFTLLGSIMATFDRRAYERYVSDSQLGYESNLPQSLWALAMFAALITLVATITATALAAGEARRDLATLAAVGARPGLRRGMAAAQAGLLAFAGTATGVLVGGVPAAITGLAITSSSARSAAVSSDMSVPRALVEALGTFRHGYVVFPWTLLLVALVVVPLVAAAIGALLAGGRVDMTRRMD